MMEALDFLCLNCQNLIKADLVNRHSQVCAEVQPALLKLEQDCIRLLNLKIDKLKCALETCEPQALPADPQLLARLSQLSVALILTESERLQETCCNTAVEIERVLDNFQGSLCVRLYGERLRMLAQEKATELATGPQESLEARVERKRKEAEQLREQVEFYRKRSQALQLGDINSAVGRRSSWEDSQAQGSQDHDFDTHVQVQAAETTSRSSEELQRYFYSQCLQVKMSFGTRHPAQAVPLPSLYQKAQQQAVPVDQWPEFIRTELSRTVGV